MALNTRDRRASAVLVGLPWRGLLPLPDVGLEDQGDRQQVGGYYRGVLAVVSGQNYNEALWAAITMRQSVSDGITMRQPSFGTVAVLDEA